MTDIAPRSIERVPLTPPRREGRTPRAERCVGRRITRDEDTTDIKIRKKCDASKVHVR